MDVWSCAGANVKIFTLGNGMRKGTLRRNGLEGHAVNDNESIGVNSHELSKYQCPVSNYVYSSVTQKRGLCLENRFGKKRTKNKILRITHI